jgi:3-methyl-2-oxobutanoate hydroxymethyltransferase
VRTKPITPPAIRARKGGEPIVCLTSYTALMARLVDPYVDLILVGDSLAMTVYGMASTVGVTLEMMIAHGRAVAQAASHPSSWLPTPVTLVAGRLDRCPSRA